MTQRFIIHSFPTMALADETMMTPSDDVVTAYLDGEAVLLDRATKRYYRLTETANQIWQALEQGLDRAQICLSMRAAFSTDEGQFEAAIDRMIAFLQPAVAKRQLS
jgi:hypothetical protein